MRQVLGEHLGQESGLTTAQSGPWGHASCRLSSDTPASACLGNPHTGWFFFFFFGPCVLREIPIFPSLHPHSLLEAHMHKASPARIQKSVFLLASLWEICASSSCSWPGDPGSAGAPLHPACGPPAAAAARLEFLSRPGLKTGPGRGLGAPAAFPRSGS